jgi:hypothetical protein
LHLQPSAVQAGVARQRTLPDLSNSGKSHSASHCPGILLGDLTKTSAGMTDIRLLDLLGIVRFVLLFEERFATALLLSDS